MAETSQRKDNARTGLKAFHKAWVTILKAAMEDHQGFKYHLNLSFRAQERHTVQFPFSSLLHKALTISSAEPSLINVLVTITVCVTVQAVDYKPRTCFSLEGLGFLLVAL